MSSSRKHARAYIRGLNLTPNQLLLGALTTAVALSLLSLLFDHAIDYDPEGWIVYAREVFNGQALNTTGFPAWKPLPVILIGPLTIITKGEGDVFYWLLITRAAAVLTVFGAAALANRFGGRVAALLAAFFVVTSPYWAGDGAVGRDSAISGALMLGVFLAHYRGWYRSSVLALTAIALLRPEATPLLFLYGVSMYRTRRLAWWCPAAAIVLIASMWLVPTIFHAGLSPAAISLNSGGANTAVNTSFPFGTVVVDAGGQAGQVAAVLTLLALLAALYSQLAPRRFRFAGAWGDRLVSLWGRSRDELMLLSAGIAWVVIVAAETEEGFAGNPRYLVPGVVLFFVVGAVVAVRVAGRSRARLLGVVVVCVGAAGGLSLNAFRSDEQLIRKRDSEVYAIRQELAQVKCAFPSHYVANHQNNAYLAQLIGEPLQDTIDWHLPNVTFNLNHRRYYWFVYCAPLT
jgi:hypothetical protein